MAFLARIFSYFAKFDSYLITFIHNNKLLSITILTNPKGWKTRIVYVSNLHGQFESKTKRELFSSNASKVDSILYKKDDDEIRISRLILNWDTKYLILFHSAGRKKWQWIPLKRSIAITVRWTFRVIQNLEFFACRIWIDANFNAAI